MRLLQRGATLAVVLMVVAIVLVLAFLVAGTSLFQLSVTQTTLARSQALNLAESAVAMALAQVEESEDDNIPVSPRLAVNLTGPGSLSFLSFAPTNPAGLPWSYNNLTGTAAAVGAIPGSPVPPASIQLVGTGRYGDEQVEVEELVHFPSYPYVVSSSGTMTSPHGGVTIAQVAAVPPTSTSQWLPGDVASNSSGHPAIGLGAGSQVTGDVQAPGTISLSPAARVLGDVQPGAAPIALPSIDVSVDPTEGYGGVQTLTSSPGRSRRFRSTAPATVVLAGLVRAPRSVTIPGDLDLTGAVVYVDGSLSVGGTLRGTGAILATGQIDVDGGAAWRCPDIMALAAAGNVTLNAPSGGGSTLVGLVYTQGNLTADNLKSYGNFVANGSAPGTGNVVLNDTTVGLPCGGSTVTLGTPVVATHSRSGCGTCLTLCIIAGPNGRSFGTRPDPRKVKIHRSVTGCLTIQWIPCGCVRTYSAPCGTGRQCLPCSVLCGLCPACSTAIRLAWSCPFPCNCPHVVGRILRYNSPQPPSKNIIVNFDLNQSLKPSERARVLLWRTM